MSSNQPVRQESINADNAPGSVEASAPENGEKNTRKDELLKKIVQYKLLRPHISAREMVKVLIKDGVCTHHTVPDSESVTRVFDHLAGRKPYEVHVRHGDEEDFNDELDEEDQYEDEQEDESILLKNEDIFTEQQLRVLKKEFKKSPIPDQNKMEEIADRIGTHFDMVYAYEEAAEMKDGSKRVDAGEKEVEPEEVKEVEDEPIECCENGEEEETNLTEGQNQELEKVYKCVRFPDIFVRDELAQKMDVKETSIRKWFIKRRARSRRERKARKEQQKTVVNTDFKDFTFLDHIMKNAKKTASIETNEGSSQKTEMTKQLENMRGEADRKKRRAQDMLIEVEATLKTIDEMEKAFQNKEARKKLCTGLNN